LAHAPTRPKLATAILELIAACSSPTPDHPKMPRPRRRPKSKPPPEGRPVDAFGVKVAKGYGSIAKMHQRPTRAARWAFQRQRSVGSMTASSPTDEYPGMV
jgi:hypothetical protein